MLFIIKINEIIKKVEKYNILFTLSFLQLHTRGGGKNTGSKLLSNSNNRYNLLLYISIYQIIKPLLPR